MHHLFRDDPDLVRRALKVCLDEDFPQFNSVVVIDSDLTEIKTITREVDTALLVETDLGPEILVIEPQSKPPTQDKKRAWHWYLSYLEAYYKAPATLIILTADRAAAAACRRPITLGPERRPSATVHPLIIGPDNAPFITDSIVAGEDVMLAVLAALAHRLNPAINTALDALAGALHSIDIESAKFFAEYVVVGLGEGGAYDHWKGIIMTMTYPFASKLREELMQKGRVEGRAEGLAQALLMVLTDHNVALSSEERTRIEACQDELLLSTWLHRASYATTAADVFEARKD